jgi:hypothetical protein
MERAVPSSPKRSAKAVIDAAVRENRSWEWLSYVLTILFAIVGLLTLLIGAVKGDGLVSLSGSLAAALFWPALRSANSIRQANIRIRLYELALTKAKTAKEAADIIRDATSSGPPAGGKTP